LLIKLAVLGAALVWDRVLGEPPEKIHPVVGMGKVTDAAMAAGITGERRRDRYSGAVLAAGLPLAVLAATSLAERGLGKLGTAASIIGGAFLLKSTFAIKSMDDEVTAVSDGLKRGDVEEARASLSRIVSRDPSAYSEDQVASAAISSVSENITDSAVGPMLMYGMFGLPGAMAYRAINTLDTMVGYEDHRRYFGEASARLDDVINLVPARVSGGIIVAAAATSGMDAKRSAKTMMNEHERTPSPNGGWSIGAAAGALGVEVEKLDVYSLGPADVRPGHKDVDRSLKLFKRAALVGAAVAAGMIVAKR
jgi:adenosylcobinamide-phosphate synthase